MTHPREHPTGVDVWRSLDELSDREDFRRWFHEEFAAGELAAPDGVSRREFLRVMAAALAMGGLVSCSRPEQIVPYVQEQPGTAPGEPRLYATGLTRGGYARGALVESHLGRPTKIEGNPDHPASLGATDAATQAQVLSLYDPDRSAAVWRGGAVATWAGFERAIEARMRTLRGRGGGGLAVLTGVTTSPTLHAQLTDLLEALPQARWHQHEAVTPDGAAAGARLAFGRDVETYPRVDRARVILSLDDDLLFDGPGSVRHARDFADGRRVRAGDAGGDEGGRGAGMNRLYVVEPTPTVTGAAADHRLPLRASRIGSFASSLARALGIEGAGARGDGDAMAGRIGAIARDLLAHRGECLVLVGRSQPPSVHALGHAINGVLGNIGRTVIPVAPLTHPPGHSPSGLPELVEAMHAGEVDTLLIVGGDPAYTAPVDLAFAEAMRRVDTTVHLGLYRGATARASSWHLPMTHELESWSDARAYDGTATIIQPLIAPLYQGRTPHQVMALLLGDALTPPRGLVMDRWRGVVGEEGFEAWWPGALRRGVVPDTAASPLDVRAPAPPPSPPTAADPPAEPTRELELVFRPDPFIGDGRHVNNAWLQELPRPLSMLTWDNAALISPAAAQRLGIEDEQLIDLHFRGRTLRAAALRMPGQAPGTVSLALGYGQRDAGSVGSGRGFNAYALRTAGHPWFGAGLTVHPTGETYPLARTQTHHSMEGRGLVRTGSLGAFREDPGGVVRGGEAHRTIPLSLYEPYRYDGQQWGMSIDLTACIGCGACTAACQAENNIPTVGKRQVRRSREMHWIRVDRYFSGDEADPAIYHQPVPCMHCENAPCELVCPVGATQHSEDGLNEMIYNRCIGTRYCSNNCPYKVRRFNFFGYTREEPEILKMLRNPDVTVRGLGVMEKCSYCVQRIREADIEARKAGGGPIPDGAIETACQQACPTRAIVFGDVNDADTAVSRAKAQPHDYGLLAELNTRPRTTYLAAIRNPTPNWSSHG